MAANVEPALEKHLVEAWPVAAWKDTHVLLAVSGGADSVALLRAALAAKRRVGGQGKLHVAHLNHGLRAAAADSDQAWLEALCRSLGVSLSVGKTDVGGLAAEQGDGWEAAARSARYEFLQKTAEQAGARFVATAHTANDQAETVLHRILRGTGLAGLAGMRASRPLSPSVTLARPLLGVTRNDVLEYLAAIGQDYRTDESNADSRFTRNRLRHELLPLIRNQFNSDVDRALVRLAAQAGEAQQWIGELTERLADECVVIEAGDRVRLDLRSIKDQPTFLVREVCKLAWARAGWPLQAAGFEMWQQLAALIQSGQNSQTLNLPGQVRAVRNASELLLIRADGFS